MRKVLTAEQMREVDRLTTERYGIPSVILMENAAHAVARVITEKVGGSVEGKSVLILCGKGNNGGDGAALARILYEAGARVEVNLFGRVVETKGDARENLERLLKIASKDFHKKGNLYFEETPVMDYWVHAVGFGIGDFDVFIDALFGTGLSRPLDSSFRNLPLAVRDRLRSKDLTTNINTTLVSVDIPSGLQSDIATETPIHLTSQVTVALTAPKPANVLPPASRFNGEVVVADIGSPQDLVDEQPSRLFYAERNDATAWIGKTNFTVDSYKNKRGHALIVAGSENYSGAAVMCGNAAMRSGVGLVTMCVPASVKSEIASRSLPEVIVRAIDEKDGEVSPDAFEEVADVLGKTDAIAVGCGLSAEDKGVETLVRRIIEDRTVPVIVDAGALWFCNPDDGLLQKPARGKGTDDKESALNSTSTTLILTPHEGEFLRLLGTEDKEVIKDRVAAVRDFATTNDVILVLKGERVLIGEPGGKVVVNPTGNSGLGKAGNGDTLAGLLAGFVAQGAKMNIDIFETVVAAVYVAGMAGDVAEKKFGKRVMTASDVRECLVDVFAELSKEK